MKLKNYTAPLCFIFTQRKTLQSLENILLPDVHHTEEEECEQKYGAPRETTKNGRDQDHFSINH